MIQKLYESNVSHINVRILTPTEIEYRHNEILHILDQHSSLWASQKKNDTEIWQILVENAQSIFNFHFRNTPVIDRPNDSTLIIHENIVDHFQHQLAGCK